MQVSREGRDSPLLVARRLGYAYAGVPPVLEDVDLAIAPQEILCLIGASGCGKSTLLRVLAGLAEPKTGELRVAGVPGCDRAATAGVVFQSPVLLPWLTVAENIGFGLGFSCRHRESRVARQGRIGRALDQVGLRAHARMKPKTLSGGMAQRVALARALARDPQIIFLDEPFSSLDAITRESMQDLLLTLARERRSAALLVTHDIDEALRIGDRVLLLAGSPARIVGEWHPEGLPPRQHRSNALNAMREEILDSLSAAGRATWYPIL